jgi:hypothetical protein
VKLAEGKYVGFNDSHLTEKLREEEGMELSRETVRRILRGAGRPSPQKGRAPRYRLRRERRPRKGMMVLTDGSRERWLEDRGPALTLLGFQDDATSEVLAARFQLECEDTVGYLRVLRAMVEEHGIPLSLYRDRHGAFQRNDNHWTEEEQSAGRQAPHPVGAGNGGVGDRADRGADGAGEGLCFILHLLGTSGNDLCCRQSLGVPNALSLPRWILSGMLI